MIKTRTETIIDEDDWNDLVKETYGRPYCFQQQDGCVSRGMYPLHVPEHDNDFENDVIPEIINGEDMGVSFKSWLSRDPNAPVGDRNDKFAIGLFWERNFYPDIQVLANDLHARGLIEAGKYLIDVDW